MDKLVVRLQDKQCTVRIWAIKALKRFQDLPEEGEELTDKVMLALCRSMSTDPQAQVRKAAIEVIVLHKTTFPSVIERTKDVSKDVRIAAFKKIGEVGTIKKLRMHERVLVAKHGMEDRDEQIRQIFVELLIGKWIPSVENDVIKLLDRLDVHINLDVCEKLLFLLFRKAYLLQDQQPQLYDAVFGAQLSHMHGTISSEQALYWRCRCQFLADNAPE